MLELVLTVLMLFPAGKQPIAAPVATDAVQIGVEKGRQEDIAKRAIERVLSFVLETQTKVGAVRFDRENQLMELRDVRVANPRGFKEENAVTADMVRVKAELKGLFSKDPVIHLIEVKGPNVNSESALGKGSNLQRLMKSARRFSDSKLLTKLPQKQWRIEKGVLQGAVVNQSTDFPKRQTSTKTLEDIEMTFPGADGKGMRADEAVVQFLARLMRELKVVDEETPVETLIDLLKK